MELQTPQTGSDRRREIVFRALDRFLIEIPSWGFPNTGTRFGKFIQDAAAGTTEEKFSDAGQVNAFTGCCPSVAVHVDWDFPDGLRSAFATDVRPFLADWRQSKGLPLNPLAAFRDSGYMEAISIERASKRRPAAGGYF